MSDELRILVVSDIHYAGAAEKARGVTESRVACALLPRWGARAFRYFIWRRHPHAHNYGVDLFLRQADSPDWVIANGDYSCDSAFVGVSDEAACQSTRECLSQFRQRFHDRFIATVGDHELGKMSLIGDCGGMRLASWRRMQDELGLPPFWQLGLGHYRLIGVTSSLVALPIYEPEALSEERQEWRRLREGHLAEIRQAFACLKPENRVLLFCHDPTALPFLWHDETVRSRIAQVEQTLIGHLHSNLFLWKSKMLAGMPQIRFLGNSIRRMSAALNEARHWRPFHVRLCPALTGIELLKDGGFYEIRLDPSARQPARYIWHGFGRPTHEPITHG